jgi:dihydrodipicolinate reductase
MISVKYLSVNPSVMKESQTKTDVRAALVGACGRMGSLIIRRILETEGITLSAAFDIVNIGKDVGEVIGVGKLDVPVSDSKDLESVLKGSKTDVLIDFTIAPATAANAPVAAAAGVNLIIGTTGLTAEQRTNITEAVIKNKIAAVISSNYSIGVGVFFKLVREAAKYLGNDYDVEIIEAHHNQKKDAPSGTALTTAEVISEAMGGKDLVYGREGICPRGKEIGIHAVRGGDIVGDHTVMFIGNSERIELRHQAHTREIFVGGAVMAAKWVAAQKKGVVYAMSDVLNK